MEEVGGIDQGGKATPQRDVSVGQWEAGIGMAAITVSRGKLWGSMGVIRNSKLYCHVEEAVFLVEKRSLLLLRDDGTAMSPQEVYDLLLVPSNGCSWDAYQIFSHLKRLGYVVGRHGTPWSMSRANRSPRAAFPALKSEEDSEPKEMEVLTQFSPKSGERSRLDDNNGHRSLAMASEVVQTRILTDFVDPTDSHEKSVKYDRSEETDDEPSLSTSEKLCAENNRIGLPSLVSNLQLSAKDPGMASRTEPDCGGLNIVFDVHYPNGRFKKTSPGFPYFSLCVVEGQNTPEHRQVRAMEAITGHNIPLKFGTVDCGHVSIFSFSTRNLPTLP